MQCCSSAHDTLYTNSLNFWRIFINAQKYFLFLKYLLFLPFWTVSRTWKMVVHSCFLNACHKQNKIRTTSWMWAHLLQLQLCSEYFQEQQYPSHYGQSVSIFDHPKGKIFLFAPNCNSLCSNLSSLLLIILPLQDLSDFKTAWLCLPCTVSLGSNKQQ